MSPFISNRPCGFAQKVEICFCFDCRRGGDSAPTVRRAASTTTFCAKPALGEATPERERGTLRGKKRRPDVVPTSPGDRSRDCLFAFAKPDSSAHPQALRS